MTSGRVAWDGYLSLGIPDGWEWREDDGTISIYNPQGVGAIQISFAEADDASAAIEPAEFVSYFAQGHGFGDVAPSTSVLGGLRASYFEGIDDDAEPSLWRVWSAGRNGRVVTISYTCRKSDREVEMARVDAIIRSTEWLF